MKAHDVDIALFLEADSAQQQQQLHAVLGSDCEPKVGGTNQKSVSLDPLTCL